MLIVLQVLESYLTLSILFFVCNCRIMQLIAKKTQISKMQVLNSGETTFASRWESHAPDPNIQILSSRQGNIPSHAAEFWFNTSASEWYPPHPTLSAVVIVFAWEEKTKTNSMREPHPAHFAVTRSSMDPILEMDSKRKEIHPRGKWMLSEEPREAERSSAKSDCWAFVTIIGCYFHSGR